MSDLESLSSESRRFYPSDVFQRTSNLSRQTHTLLINQFKENRLGTWGRLAREELLWDTDFQTIYSGTFEDPRWFEDGYLNASVQCLDRWIHTPTAQKTALIFEGEPGDQQSLTYQDLFMQVNQLAAALRNLGIQKGDRVAIYLPLIPEMIITVLACARVGATHSVVFAGFSTESLANRINDAGARLLITADGGWRKGEALPLKNISDQAVAQSPTIEKVIVVQRTGQTVSMNPQRDHWWSDLLTKADLSKSYPESVSAEHPLFLLYTSGSTGKPKGIQHGTAGYLLWAKLTTRWVLDLKPSDVYWCTADVGWITGHSYVIYGPLQEGGTIFIYEGNPVHPKPDRFWSLIEKYRISIFYTAPTAIRTFIRHGKDYLKKHDLSSLRLLGSVGEPINPEAWLWYYQEVGGGRCPIVDTWWQTETGGMMIAPIPGVHTTIPGSAIQPLPGIEIDIQDRAGRSQESGFLVITSSWPSQLRGIWGDHERYQKTYHDEIKGVYFSGDGARRDGEGNIWLMGRVDDVLNVSGHRLGTAEIESAIVAHPCVAEAAVVGRPDAIKGEGIVAFITLKSGMTTTEEELKAHVTREIGALARPDEIRFAEGLPKTRSGKIMRRLLRDLARGEDSHQDTSTLEDLRVVEKLRKDDAEE